jgi:hypothetical protein
MSNKPTITVGKRWDKGAEYIGRPSPLGNPYYMANESQRDRVCDQYEAWFKQRLRVEDPVVMHELARLHATATRTGHLVLGCYCAPKRCHGDTIKRWLDNYSL